MDTAQKQDAAAAAAEDSVDAIAERVATAAMGAAELLSIYLGDRLGWYEQLAAWGPMTAAELASRTGTHPRYAREWLEQQAAVALLSCDATAEAEQRLFTVSPAVAEVLTDRNSLAYLAPLARMLAAASGQLPALLDAYRTGGGVGWSQFGADARESQADMNRPWYEQRLGDALAGVPAVHEALSRPDARIADIGCGAGWSTIALARAYPHASIEGHDVDGPSVEAARRNADAAGIGERVRFVPADAASLPRRSFDAVFAFECVHDMPHPVQVLAAAAEALRPDGFVLVMDEAVDEQFNAPAGDLERLMYGFSLLVCLPDGMSHPHSAGTGTVMRPGTLAEYGRRAGLPTMDVLPIDDFGFWRFYRLGR
jgi:SAM-dependent methyltransferase